MRDFADCHKSHPVHVGARKLKTYGVPNTLHVFNGGSVGTRISTVVSVFFISLLLGKARNRSGGILVPMLCHAVINFINVTVLVTVHV